MKNIKSIKSPFFTTDLPARSKFKMHETVRLRNLDDATHPALKRYGAGAAGYVVGMRYKKGNYFRVYPYYIEFNDGYIFPVKPCYLEYFNKKVAIAAAKKRNQQINLRHIVEQTARDLLKQRTGSGALSIRDMEFTDKAIRKIRKIFE